jgi:serine/threonine-protein kinase
MMTLAPGTRLGPYEILAPVGAGGMGEVYRARDMRLMRTVAIKVLSIGSAIGIEARRRFEREARLISGLTHPNICTVYDIGRHEAVEFLVMEYLDGETLAARLNRGPLPLDEAIERALAIAEALDHAHQHGIVHRDLKPANVMLMPAGTKLLDFGLAIRRHRLLQVRPDAMSCNTSEHLDLTEPGMVLGTFGYMSPEQLEGREADARSDLFAFGALLYEMTGGRRAFHGTSQASVIAAVLRAEPPPLTGLGDRTAAVQDIVERCLAKRPAERYQSAAEVARALRTIPAHDGQRPHPAARWRPVAAIAIVAAIGGAAWFASRHTSHVGSSPANALSEHAAIQSVAVLPLRNLSRDPGQDYFTDGLTEALITDLSKLGVFRVISRSSSIRFKDTPQSVQDVARALNVDGIVEGSVLRAGDRVRITAALVREPSGEQLWANAYDRNVHDVLALHADVAEAIAAEIGTTVTSQPRATSRYHPPRDERVHDLYMKGRFAWQQWTADGARRAIDLFNAALDIDPSYPLAYSGLAEAYYGLSNIYIAPSEVMPRAKAAALRAIELDETLAEPHAVLGVVKMGFDWDWSGAEREFKRAIQLNPNNAAAHEWYTTLLISLGRFVEAAGEARLGQQLDPMTPMVDIFETWPLLYARDYQQSIVKLRRLMALEPNFYATHAHLGIALLQLHQFDEALAEFGAARRLDDAAWISGWLGHAYGVAGRRKQARRVLAELVERSKRDYVLPYARAIIHTGLGDVDAAMDTLDEAYEKRDEQLVMLAVDPAVDGLRASPRFDALLARVGLSEVARRVPRS